MDSDFLEYVPYLNDDSRPRCKHNTPNMVLCDKCCLEWLSGLTKVDEAVQ